MSRLRHLPPLFFLGFFPVVILLWAWADSMRHDSGWFRAVADKSSEGLQLRSSALVHLRFEIIPPLASSFPIPHIIPTESWGDFSRLEVNPAYVGSRKPFPAPARTQEVLPASLPEPSQMVLSRTVIPLWLILTAYLPVWLGLAYWQARRRHAKIQASLPPSPDSNSPRLTAY
ncbi:hypothetical protein [Haloferula sp. BvORR071]|uniref:hypothetical protein n=1 Tax=Haloferula sp. BvORR071 TaxID=1396141 RepID=UPI000556CC4A|nr:hypothetical protein [Haloferula sp. BvORR071]